jgi:lipopolysaccharide/colanic/teichoic acid biosynthesis glycosyltransferase
MPAPRLTRYLTVKAVLEFVCALVLFIVTVPLIGLLALLVRLTSSGPAFYLQRRLGKAGRVYRIIKLRTMYHNCESYSGPKWSTNGDLRITPLGRFLRRIHLDELPQLWNVLRGDMSLVGPRPERPEFVPALEQAIPHYRDRLLVRPGVTGLAQVQLPADTNLESVRRKVACDVYYVRRASFWLDVRILMATVLHVLGLPYGLIGRLLQLPRGAAIDKFYQAHRPHLEGIAELQTA